MCVSAGETGNHGGDGQTLQEEKGARIIGEEEAEGDSQGPLRDQLFFPRTMDQAQGARVAGKFVNMDPF